MKYILAIDQGGTKTDAIVTDVEGNILSKSKAGGACYVYDGIDDALRYINEAAESAVMEADITINQIDLISVCMTGADWPSEYVYLKDELKKLFRNENVRVENDCIGALRGGTNALPCGIICLGTGANIALRSADGKQIIYGYFVEFKDQGAGGLGKQAFDAVMKAHIGTGPETSLTEAIIHNRASSPEDLLYKYTMDKLTIHFTEFSRFVFDEAMKGDGVSLTLINEMAERLSRYITAGVSKLGIDLSHFELILSGGLFKGNGSQMVERITQIFKKHPGIRIANAACEPVVGAALLGLDAVYNNGIPVTVSERINESCKKFNLIRTEK